MNSFWIKLALILALQILVLFGYPNKITLTFSNPPPDPSTQQTQFNCPCHIPACPVTTCTRLASDSFIDLLCKMINADELNDIREKYCRSSERCMMGFDIAKSLCDHLHGQYNNSTDVFLVRVLEIILGYNTTFQNSNEEQTPT